MSFTLAACVLGTGVRTVRKVSPVKCAVKDFPLLHVDKSDTANTCTNPAKVTASTSTEPTKESAANSSTSPAETCGHSGAGKDRCLLSIQVKSVKGDQGLEVSSVDGNVFDEVPETLTQKKIPASVDNILTAGDLAKLPYLAKLELPIIKANADLLIGSKAPKLLEPWEVINSHGNGPYALRTALEWVINGPLHESDSK